MLKFCQQIEITAHSKTIENDGNSNHSSNVYPNEAFQAGENLARQGAHFGTGPMAPKRYKVKRKIRVWAPLRAITLVNPHQRCG